MRLPSIVLAIVLCAVVCPVAASENLSNGRRVILYPQPNLFDHSRPEILVDGSEPGEITAEACIGWRDARRIWITIELGSLCEVHSVTVSTAATKPGVSLPKVLAFTEEPDRGFFNYIHNSPFVAGPQEKGSKIVRLTATDIKHDLKPAHCRRVRIELIPSPEQPLTINEVVVTGKRIEPVPAATTHPTSPRTERKPGSTGLFRKPEPVLRSADHMRTRLELDFKQVQKNAARLPVEQQQALAILNDQLKSEIAALDQPTRVALRQGPPYSPLHRKLYLLNAKIAQGLFSGKTLLAWAADPWDTTLNPLLLPPSESSSPQLNARVLQNEYEPLAFNLTNTSGEDLPLRVTVDGLKPDAITVHDAIFVELSSRDLTPDALPIAKQSNSEWNITVPAGSTKQVWLTIRKDGLPSGEYAGTVGIRGQGIDPPQIPINVEVLPIRLPDKKHLQTSHWAYLDWPLTQGREKQAYEDLLAHYQNVHVISWIYRPVVSQQDGKTILDFTNLDKALDFEPEAEMYLIWLGMDGDHRTLGIQGDFMAAEWSRAFGHYLRQLTEHLKKRGIGYDRFALYLADEPSMDPRRGDSLFLDVCALVKLCDPHVQLYSNACFEEQPPNAVSLLGAAYDILCPQMHYVDMHSAVDEYVATGKPIWTYMIGTGKTSSPLRYFRHYAWKTWTYGFTGASFWNYCDTGWGNFDSAERGAWDDFDNIERGADSSFVYESEQPELITSRRWEAWREAVEDYEYLWMLRDAIERAKKTGKQGAVVADAEQVLREVPRAFLAAGDDASASTALAEARRKIQDSLLQLQ